MLEQHPTAADVSKGLLAEPDTRSIPVPVSEEGLAALAGEWSPAHVEEVLAKRRAWREARIFGVQDMAYVLYFDAEGRLQAYVLMGR